MLNFYDFIKSKPLKVVLTTNVVHQTLDELLYFCGMLSAGLLCRSVNFHPFKFSL